MSNIKLAWMADELRDAGLTVIEVPGWKTRTMPTSNTYNPVGVMNHHTVGTVYTYPYTFLQDKCNIVIFQDGTVAVLNAGYAYDSGLGTPYVLNKVLSDETFTWDEIKDKTSTTLMNPHYIDIEVVHKGDGSYIPQAQYDALIATNRVLCDHYGWDPETRVIGHSESAPDRKQDPRWSLIDGVIAPKYVQMPVIRADTKKGGGVFPLRYDDKHSDVGWLQGELNNNRPDGVEPLKLDGKFGPSTAEALRREFPGATEGVADEDLVVEGWWMSVLARRNRQKEAAAAVEPLLATIEALEIEVGVLEDKLAAVKDVL